MAREREKIMLVGVGELGGIVLEYLCRIPNVGPIVAADANADWGFRKTNSAIEGASYMGLYPAIEFHPIDVLNIERTAELLRTIKPTVICNATTLQSWWVVNELPPDVNAKLYRDVQRSYLETVRALLAPNLLHHMYLAECVGAFPEARVFGAPVTNALRARLAMAGCWQASAMPLTLPRASMAAVP